MAGYTRLGLLFVMFGCYLVSEIEGDKSFRRSSLPSTKMDAAKDALAKCALSWKIPVGQPCNPQATFEEYDRMGKQYPLFFNVPGEELKKAYKLTCPDGSACDGKDGAPGVCKCEETTKPPAGPPANASGNDPPSASSGTACDPAKPHAQDLAKNCDAEVSALHGVEKELGLEQDAGVEKRFVAARECTINWYIPVGKPCDSKAFQAEATRIKAIPEPSPSDVKKYYQLLCSPGSNCTGSPAICTCQDQVCKFTKPHTQDSSKNCDKELKDLPKFVPVQAEANGTTSSAPATFSYGQGHLNFWIYSVVVFVFSSFSMQ